MSIPRRRSNVSPRELVARAGLLPACLAASLVSLASPLALLAQPAAEPPAVRDPMKPGKDGGDKPVVKVSDHNTVDLHVKDEDLANVLQLLSMQTQKNIIASKNVSARVTATLYGVTFYEALDAILHVNGFGYLEKGNFIYVYTSEELKQIEAALKKRVAKVIRLNYLNATDAKNFASPLLSKDGGEIQTAEKTANFTIPDKSPTGKDDFAMTATIVVIDFEENIKAIEDLLTQIDTRPSQVLIEATILQTSLSEENAFGIDFSVIGDLKFTDFLNIGGPLGAANGLIRGGTGGSASGLSPTDNQGTAVTSSPGNTAGKGTFKVGVVAGDLSIFLKALDEVTDTIILSNPKILTLNRQPARVLVGTRVGYLSTTSTDTSTTQTVEFLDTGTQLYFRPFVSSEGDIRMELKPQVSSAEIRTVTDSNGAAVTIPDEITQELVTNVNVRDGQTIVLGGLFTDNQTFTRRQVPWLGDIPIVGAAFRGNEDSTDRSEIIFMVTPTIITDQSVAAAAEKAQSDMERLRAGSRQGLLPFSRERMTAQLNVEAEKFAREGQHDKALWLIQRSLSLNPRQPEVYRLRERITGEREIWPDPSRMEGFFGDESTQGLGEIKTQDPAPKHSTPWGSVDQPRRKVSNPGSVSYNFSRNDPLAQALLSNNAENLQGTMNVSLVPQNQANQNQPNQAQNASANNAAQANANNSTSNLNNAQLDGLKGTPVVRPTNAPAQASSNGSIESMPTMNDPAPVQASLAEIRTYLKVLIEESGSMPALGTGANDGWETFVVSGLLPEAPANTFIGGPNARKVVIGFNPDSEAHSNYGWIFNPDTGELWAAGLDAKDQPLASLYSAEQAEANAAKAAEAAAAQAQNQNLSQNQSQPQQSSVQVETVQPE